MERPFPAYAGNEPYVFVCYAHADSGIIYPELVWLKEHGCHIWYDEGIAPGEEWTEELAHAIREASHVLYFVTADSIQSRKCRDEINFALDHDIHLVSVHLTETQLSDGLSLTIGLTQAILKYELSEQDYHAKLLSGIGAPRSDAPTPSPVQQPSNNSRLIGAGFGLFILAILGVGLLLFNKPTSETAEPPVAETEASIAVLPFANRSASEEDAFFVDGLHDDLLTHISKIGSIKTISRTSVMQYRNTSKTIPQIAKELGVATIMEGGVQRAGDTIRINVQLIDAATDEHLWAQIYDRQLTAANIFAIQSEIATAIAEALRATLSLDEQQRLASVPTMSLPALEAYFLGKQRMAKRTVKTLAEAVDYFQRAIELDPNFALAYVGLADTYTLQIDYTGLPLDEMSAKSELAINKALALDDRLGEAYASLGLLSIDPQNGRPRSNVPWS